MMTQLTNVAFFRAKRETVEELGSRLLALVESTRSEPGCSRYDIYQSSNDPQDWFIHEDWRSPADFDAHMQAPYISAFMPLVPDLCERDVEIRSFVPRSSES
jgi:quinol monooxygenase YgiN